MPDGSLRRWYRLRLVESTSRGRTVLPTISAGTKPGVVAKFNTTTWAPIGGVLVQDEDVLADEPDVLEAGSRASGVSGLDQLPVQVQRGTGVRLLGGHVDSVSVGSDG
jgi:hypothetical protein